MISSQMKAFTFISGFIWFFVGAGSLILGPFVGFNRKTVKAESAQHWANFKKVKFRAPSLPLFLFAYIGFLFPSIHPLIGAVVGMCLMLIS